MTTNFKVEIDAGTELGDKLSGDSIVAERDVRALSTDRDITVTRGTEVYIFETDGPLATVAAAPDEIPDGVYFAVEELPCADERDERGRRPTFVSAELNERRKNDDLNQPQRIAASLAN